MAPLYPSFTKTYHHDVYPTIDPISPKLACPNKIILITGGGRGIGQAIAIAFAQAAAKGIALLGRTKSSLEETEKKVKEISPQTDVFITVADITSQEQIRKSMDEVVKHFNNTVPDVLVNNAGGSSGNRPIIDVDIDQLWKAFELNTKGPLMVSQAFLQANRRLTPETPRTLINVPSGAAHIPYMPTAAAYGTSKLASTKLNEYVHFEHPDWNVFNLQPGVVDTDLARAAGRKAPDSPRLPAGMAVWLSTQPEARELNGKFLWANWDVEEVLERKEEIQKKDLLTMVLRGWGEDVDNVVTAEELIRRARSVHRDADKKE